MNRRTQNKALAMNKLTLLKARNCLIAWLPKLAEWEGNLKLLKAARTWRKNGWIMPPPYEVKRAMLKTEALRIGATNFVETGTYMGDTVWALRKDFIRLFSIEVQPQLAAIAAVRFRHMPKAKIVCGDSASELSSIVQQIDGPCLFWLDGHYSAGITGRGRHDCPIFEELDAIHSGMKFPYSVLIDDARCFGTDKAYPSIGEINDITLQRTPEFNLAVRNDVIFLTKQ